MENRLQRRSAMVVVLVLSLFAAACHRDGHAIDDPPILAVGDFTYDGAFRLPADDFGVSNLNYAQGPLALGEDAASIFIVGHTYDQAIAEFEIPALIAGTTVGDLAMAEPPTQPFARVLDRPAGGNPQALDRITGLTVHDGQLLVNAIEYYDAPGDNTHTTLVVHDDGALGTATTSEFVSLAGAAHAAGWFSDIPEAWRDGLGGDLLTGSSSGMPIIGRLSVGPTAFAVDPAQIVAPDAPAAPVATEQLVGYSLAEPLRSDLLNEAGDNDLWTHLSRAVFGFIVPDTQTYAVFGSSGGHGPDGICYKCTPTGATEACGGYCAVDPADGSAYFWFYDVQDLIDVRSGTLSASAVEPYEYGEFVVPFANEGLGGGAYDAVSGTLYLTALAADREQGAYANPPIVVAYHVSIPENAAYNPNR